MICRRVLMVVILASFYLSVSNCAVRQPAETGPTRTRVQIGQSWIPIQSGGKERFYLLYVPTTYKESTAIPLVLNLHGSRSNPFAQLAYSDFKNLAEAKGFMVALPFGEYQKERGRNSWNTTGDPGGVDDLAFVRDILKDLGDHFTIDPRRIYATGFSGGARMVSKLACELGETLAAVAPVAGVQFPSDCGAGKALPIIAFHGRLDKVNTYAHGRSSRDYWTAGVEDSLAGWADRNGCAREPQSRKVSEAVTGFVWEECRDGAQITFYSIADGGHTWPGSSINVSQPWAGKTNTDISASQLIWAFFEAHPR